MIHYLISYVCRKKTKTKQIVTIRRDTPVPKQYVIYRHTHDFVDYLELREI